MTASFSSLFVFVLVLVQVDLNIGSMRYEGDKIFRMVPRNKQEVWVLQHLQDKSKIDFSTSPSGKILSASIQVKPQHVKHTKDFLEQHNVRFVMEDSGDEDELIDNDHKDHDRDYDDRHDPNAEESDPDLHFFDEFDTDESGESSAMDSVRDQSEEDHFFNFRRADIEDMFDYKTFHPYYELEEQILYLAERDPAFQVFSLGLTSEGRNITVMKLSATSNRSSNISKKMIVLECGIHAREWISPAACMFILGKLSDTNSPSSVRMLQKYDWLIIPVFNVDGYIFSWKTEHTRQWRKSRSYSDEQIQTRTNSTQLENSTCVGVDLNRNFGYHWGERGSSQDPCGQMYAGPYPFSEPETRAFASYMIEHQTEIISHVAVHSFGLVWCFPWGYKGEDAEDTDELKRVATALKHRIYNKYQINYGVGSSFKYIYPTSGSSTDWMHGQLRIKYTYFVELGPKKETFLATEQELVENSEALLEGLSAMSEEMKDVT